MTHLPDSTRLQALLGDFDLGQLVSEIYGRQPLHRPANGQPHRFESLIDWREPERLLNINAFSRHYPEMGDAMYQALCLALEPTSERARIEEMLGVGNWVLSAARSAHAPVR